MKKTYKVLCDNHKVFYIKAKSITKARRKAKRMYANYNPYQLWEDVSVFVSGSL